MSNLYLVLPAYNPGSAITDVLAKALDRVHHVVIVDDGCDAQNKSIIAQCLPHQQVTLLSHDRNLGKGHALVTGINHCLSVMQEDDYILAMDSDGQHAPDDIDRFTALLQTTTPHLVLGERLQDSAMPARSRAGNAFARGLFRLLFGSKVHDTQTGFRLLSYPFASLFVERVRPGRYETEMDMLILASRSLDTIHSVTIQTLYFDNNSNSKFKPVRDSYSILKTFLKYGGVSIASFLADYLLFLLFTYLVGVPYLIANVMARVVSAVLNFYGHKLFSFRTRGHTLAEAAKYLAAVINSLLISSLLLYVVVESLAIAEFIAKPLVDGIVFVLNFYILSRLVFSVRKLRQADDGLPKE